MPRSGRFGARYDEIAVATAAAPTLQQKTAFLLLDFDRGWTSIFINNDIITIESSLELS